MQKIFILGSCVTRDPFELAIKKYDITYLARTSFASAFQIYLLLFKEKWLRMTWKKIQKVS